MLFRSAVFEKDGRHVCYVVQRGRLREREVAVGSSNRDFAVIERGPSWSLLRCRLETGRTHQIRVHLHSIGHALIGDRVYRLTIHGTKLPAEALDFPRQALHAVRLTLVHPQTGETQTWEAPVPTDIVRLLSVLRDA